SAANEVAVAAFLAGQLRWSHIVPVVRDVLDRYEAAPLESVAHLRDVDDWARRTAHEMMKGR
ncbi:MAG: 1-deoxy-D-xylulose-5-phosphate reductoisomerase, partial [Acidobacteria bacterium]|nr:1-deoxy-D-xylulose-5-phosphate reductoisomerase [Acidobacteriota bacterium]